MTSGLRVFADAGALAHACAAAVSDAIVHAIDRRGRCALALSGGSTPRALYRALAAEFRSLIPWGQVDVFWGDERFVPATSPDSNYGMARGALLVHVPIPVAHLHPIPTDAASPEEAAGAYAETLRAYFRHGLPRFDLVLLGIGEDCHTASLFPHSPAVVDHKRLVVATQAPDTSWRVSLAPAVLMAADAVFVLATGVGKAAAIKHALSPGTDIDDCPAAALRRREGPTVWWLDREAASALDPSRTM